MNKRCVAAGYSSIYKKGLHLYGFPKDPGLRKKWENQVMQTTDKWEPHYHRRAHCYLSSTHLKMAAFSHTAS